MAMKTVVKPSVQKNRSIIPRPAVPREILETIQAQQLLKYDHGVSLKIGFNVKEGYPVW